MAGFGSNAAVVFEEADVADMVVAVFDAPMVSDGGAECLRRQPCLGGMESGFLGAAPEACLGVFTPGEAGDANGHDDQAMPFGAETARDLECLDPAMLLSSVAVAVDGLEAVDGRLGAANGLDLAVQDWLIGFDLGDQGIASIPGRFKGFFDSAWRRR